MEGSPPWPPRLAHGANPTHPKEHTLSDFCLLSSDLCAPRIRVLCQSNRALRVKIEGSPPWPPRLAHRASPTHPKEHTLSDFCLLSSDLCAPRIRVLLTPYKFHEITYPTTPGTYT